MIGETNAFLSWALDQRAELPRIPSRRADVGGFDALLAQPNAKLVVQGFWRSTLERVPV